MMRQLMLLAVLALIGVGCREHRLPQGPSPGNPQPAPAPSPGFSGRIVDFTTNVGVAGATVSFGSNSATTRADGSYALDIAAGMYEPSIDDLKVGLARVTGSSYRGDFFIRTGTCVGRYGTITDRGTAQPIAAATVSLGGQNVVTATDGWYRIDLACPAAGIIGFNTAFITVSHPDYANASWVAGRGIAGQTRMDIEMNRK